MPEGIDLHDVLSGDAQAWANAGAAIIIGLITVLGWMRTKRVNSGLRSTVTTMDVSRQYDRIEGLLKQIQQVLLGMADMVGKLSTSIENRAHQEELDREFRRGQRMEAERRESDRAQRNRRSPDGGDSDG